MSAAMNDTLGLAQRLKTIVTGRSHQAPIDREVILPAARALERLDKENIALLAALNGLVGLVQLVRSRDDCPVEIKQALSANYRLDDAFGAIALSMPDTRDETESSGSLRDQADPGTRERAKGNDVVKLLRALATGSVHKANKHDIIFTAAADEIERLREALEQAKDSPFLVCRSCTHLISCVFKRECRATLSEDS